MRVFGTFLVLLGIVGLILGVATGMAAYQQGMAMAEKIRAGERIVDGSMEDVREVYDEVMEVFDDSKQVVADYQNGRLTSLRDERVERVFNDINRVLGQIESVRPQVSEALEEIEDLRRDVGRDVAGLATVAVVSIGSLILSGWLFGFGMMFRSLGSRA